MWWWEEEIEKVKQQPYNTVMLKEEKRLRKSFVITHN
jgi:hypothetical protein